MPAYLDLGDLRLAQDDPAQAIAAWEQAVDVSPSRAYLAFDRLQGTYSRVHAPERFAELSDAGAQHVIFSVRGVDEPGRLELIGREIIEPLRSL